MKKIYFLTRPQMAATRSGKWRNRLKNTYKSTDAIRDICLLQRRRGGNPDSGRWDGPPSAA